MISLMILLVGAQFGSILTQDDPDATEAPTDGDEPTDAPSDGDEPTDAPSDGDESTAAPDGGDESTAAPDGGDETTAAGDGDGGDETTAAPETTTAKPTTAAPKPTTVKTTKRPTKATPKPTPVKCRACYRNPNGICRTFDIACTKKGLNLLDRNNIKWTLSEGDCAKRVANEPKICSSDCPRFKKANCRAAPTPVCGYSKKRKMCRKYPSFCHLKKNACNNPNIGDWRVAKMTACRGLRVGAPAVRCNP